MDDAKKTQLAVTATRVRMGILEGVYNAKSGHPGGSLSIADYLTYLYFEEMNIDPKNPKWADRGSFCPFEGPLRAGALLGAGSPGLFPGGAPFHPA